MIQRVPFSDYRINNICTFCGEYADSKDHVPSKVFLDEPFPKNLPLVPCCKKCNQGFSLDEEYIACFLECLKSSSADIERLAREKIKKTLHRKESLRKKIENSINIQDDRIIFNIEEDRLLNVLLKLIRGHIRFEYDEILLDNKPSKLQSISFLILPNNNGMNLFNRRSWNYCQKLEAEQCLIWS